MIIAGSAQLQLRLMGYYELTDERHWSGALPAQATP
jgi:hypothetical protein